MMVPVVIMKIGLTLDCHKVGLGVLLQFGGVFGVKCGKAWWMSAAKTTERVKNDRKDIVKMVAFCAFLRFLKMLTHNRRKFWYNTH